MLAWHYQTAQNHLIPNPIYSQSRPMYVTLVAERTKINIETLILAGRRRRERHVHLRMRQEKIERSRNEEKI
jgi:hypothetical protein